MRPMRRFTFIHQDERVGVLFKFDRFFFVGEVNLRIGGLEKIIPEVHFVFVKKRFSSLYHANSSSFSENRLHLIWEHNTWSYMAQITPISDCIAKAVAALSKITFEPVKLLCEKGDK